MNHAWAIALLGVLCIGCQSTSFVTPPADPLGNNLNSLHSEKNPRLSDEGRYLVFSSEGAT